MKDQRPAYRARFWDYINGSWVKLTLKPGQRIQHEQRGQHDEGWWIRQSAWVFDGNEVVSDTVDDGTDCDGRLSRGMKLACPVERLFSRIQTLPYAPNMGHGAIGLPDWAKIQSGQRDHTAEAAGY